MARKRETDLSRYDWSKAKRGKYLDRARRSFDTLVVDKKLLETLGGSEAAVEILRAVAKAITESRKKRPRRGRRSSAGREQQLAT